MEKKKISALVIAICTISITSCGVEQIVDNGQNDTQQETSAMEEPSPVVEDAAQNTDDNVVIEITEGYVNSPEFQEAFDSNIRIGGPYHPAGAAEVTEYSDWQEAYDALIQDLNSEGDSIDPKMIYVNDDDIPEMVYEPSENNMIIATFDGEYINLFSSKLSSMSYIEKANNLYATERVGAYYDDYVVAIKDGAWVQIAYGVRGPIDEWAEDSFDENGEPIISYWLLNDVELKSQEDYDNEFKKFYDPAYAKAVEME
ncbi:MAG: hypothetical protein K5883_08585 [Pseudobutyrivibrio sp.]|nr:hypothetical protein [Pseudobutyrivibrio sp.]